MQCNRSVLLTRKSIDINPPEVLYLCYFYIFPCSIHVALYCDVRGYHSGVAEDSGILGCYVMFTSIEFHFEGL